MTKKTKIENLNEDDLNDIRGGALLLPAVQAAREAARRTSSSDNTGSNIIEYQDGDDPLL